MPRKLLPKKHPKPALQEAPYDVDAGEGQMAAFVDDMPLVFWRRADQVKKGFLTLPENIGSVPFRGFQGSRGDSGLDRCAGTHRSECSPLPA